MNKYNKKKYRKDFPAIGTFNWKTVRFIMPEDRYYDGTRMVGALLHDGNFMTNGVLFLSNQFEIIDENPLDLK